MKTSLQFVMNNLNFKIFAHKIMTRAVHVPAEFLYLSRFYTCVHYRCHPVENFVVIRISVDIFVI